MRLVPAARQSQSAGHVIRMMIANRCIMRRVIGRAPGGVQSRGKPRPPRRPTAPEPRHPPTFHCSKNTKMPTLPNAPSSLARPETATQAAKRRTPFVSLFRKYSIPPFLNAPTSRTRPETATQAAKRHPAPLHLSKNTQIPTPPAPPRPPSTPPSPSPRFPHGKRPGKCAFSSPGIRANSGKPTSPPAPENSNFPTRNFPKFRPTPVAHTTTSRPLRPERHINHHPHSPRHRRDTDEIPT